MTTADDNDLDNFIYFKVLMTSAKLKNDISDPIHLTKSFTIQNFKFIVPLEMRMIFLFYRQILIDNF